MKTYFDASAFSKRYIEEAGSDYVDEICLKTSLLALSIISIPEIISALNRRRSEKYLTEVDYRSAKKRLMIEVNDIIMLNITPKVIQTSIALLEKYTLRTLDALHIACAIEWKPELFVSADKKQTEIARRSDLNIVFIENN